MKCFWCEKAATLCDCTIEGPDGRLRPLRDSDGYVSTTGEVGELEPDGTERPMRDAEGNILWKE